jgi:hypothetical protein
MAGAAAPSAAMQVTDNPERANPGPRSYDIPTWKWGTKLRQFQEQ